MFLIELNFKEVFLFVSLMSLQCCKLCGNNSSHHISMHIDFKLYTGLNNKDSEQVHIFYLSSYCCF